MVLPVSPGWLHWRGASAGVRWGRPGSPRRRGEVRRSLPWRAWICWWVLAVGSFFPCGAAVAPQPDAAAAKRHWAFQPVRRVSPPNVRARGAVFTPVDAFIVARLESVGVVPSALADRRVLLRRVFYDLVGLPPSYEEAQAFGRDGTPDPFARQVDRP